MAVSYCSCCDVSAAEYDVPGLVYGWGWTAKCLPSRLFLSVGKVRFFNFFCKRCTLYSWPDGCHCIGRT